mgnify:CR=1 FL=1
MDYQPAHFATLPPPEAYDRHPLYIPENLRVEQISDTGYWINSMSNAGWVITEEGVVLIDSGANRPEVIQALRRTTDKPIRYVIYTHGHGDHTFTVERYEDFADTDTLTVIYEEPIKLMADLHAMGEANAAAESRKGFTRRSTLMAAAARYRELFADDGGRVPATFQIITLTGWAPDPSQQQPLKPGSAEARLADALDTVEIPAGEKAKPAK